MPDQSASSNTSSLTINTTPLEREVRPGDDLAELAASLFTFSDFDVLVVTQKIVSKAEGRIVECDPNDQEAFSQLVVRESRRILRQRDTLAITETPHGFVCANAGIDHSNTEPGTLTLLPLDPDKSAHRIALRLARITSKRVAIVVTDTFGRTWRNGVVDVAIGSSGLITLLDLRGTRDHFGTPLVATEVCIVDEIAAAANLVIGKAAKTPFVHIRGIDPSYFGPDRVSTSVVRSYHQDLFR
ncbi:MAG: coenzyme F420-0:L-glutamate ligase [Ferrimicrobium sp.]